MAKRRPTRRRRSLNGTTVQHTKYFRLRVEASRNAAKLAIKNAKKGNCEDALHWLRRAAENEGAASAHFENLPSSTVMNQDIERMGLASSDLNRAERVVRSCRRR